MKKLNKLNFLKKPKSKKRQVKSILGVKTTNDEYYKKYNDITGKKHKKKHRKLKKAILIILCILLSIIIILLSCFAYLYFSGKSQFEGVKPKLNIPANVVTDNDGEIIEYNNKKYRYDNDVTSILCIGVDKNEKTQIKKENAYGNAGQADALYLICIDNKEKKYTIISINRDSMVNVDVFSKNGKYAGIKNMQICTSFAYGDGKEKSCENTVKAVSRLFYNIPIDSYFSINKACIPLLNDMIDGVDVPVYDSNGKITTQIVHLEGKASYNYIHDRDISKLDSNLQRINRQISYIKAFASKAIAKTRSDITTPLDMYETISLYSTSDLNASKITYLTVNALSDRNDINLDFKSVSGKVVKGKDGYAEYEVNNKNLLKLIIDVFYDEVKN